MYINVKRSPMVAKKIYIYAHPPSCENMENKIRFV